MDIKSEMEKLFALCLNNESSSSKLLVCEDNRALSTLSVRLFLENRLRHVLVSSPVIPSS